MSDLFDISSHFKKHENAVFIRHGHQQISYKSFFQNVIQISEIIKSQGVVKGDLVVLKDASKELLPLLFFAIWKSGAIAFPVNPKFNDEIVKQLISDSGAKHFIGSGKQKENFSTNMLQVEQDYKDVKIESARFKIDINQPATLMMTSGSNGKAKYVLHSFKNHFYNAYGVNEYFKITAQTQWLLSLPFFHVGGFAILIRCFLTGAKACIIQEKQSHPDALKMYRPSHLSLVFTQLQRLLKDKHAIVLLKECKAIFLGGSAIPESVLEKALGFDLNIFSGYGLTEMASTVAIRNHKNETNNKAKILSHHDLKTVNGEICLKGPCLFLGYYTNSKVELPTSRGWFFTKDLGSKEGNQVTVTGRKDNMFISGGENIQPEEIEKILLSMDGIAQAIVVPVESNEYGHRPVAFVRYEKTSRLNNEGVFSLLKQKLPSYKIPDKLLSWPDSQDVLKSDLKTNRSEFKNIAKNLNYLRPNT